MKKILSLALTFAIIVSTLVTMGVVSANSVDTNIKTTVIDLTQDVANLFATTGNTTATTATVEGGKLKVHVSAYERQLSAYSESQRWYPNYLLAVDGSVLKPTNGNKAIVEVKYKVTGTPNATHGTQIGISTCQTANKNTNVYLKTYKKHTGADQGKEFTLTSVYTVDAKYAIQIAFSGGGDIEISSIVVHELPAAEIDNYAVVAYMDGNDKSTEFVKKNTTLKTPVKAEYSFGGWYSNAEFTGAKVESVSADTTLYAKWVAECTHANKTTTNTATYFKAGVETVVCDDCGETISTNERPCITTAPVTFNKVVLNPETNQLKVEWEYSDALAIDLSNATTKELVVKFVFGDKEYSVKLDDVDDLGQVLYIEGINAARFAQSFSISLEFVIDAYNTTELNVAAKSLAVKVSDTIDASNEKADEYANLIEQIGKVEEAVVDGVGVNSDDFTADYSKIDIANGTAEIKFIATQDLIDTLKAKAQYNDGRKVTLVITIGEESHDVTLKELKSKITVKISGLSFDQMYGSISAKLVINYADDAATDVDTKDVTFNFTEAVNASELAAAQALKALLG